MKKLYNVIQYVYIIKEIKIAKSLKNYKCQDYIYAYNLESEVRSIIID